MQAPIRISLRAARVNAQLTQREAAKCLGICVATLQNYEAGATTPDWEIVQRITELYHIPMDYIFFRRDNA